MFQQALADFLKFVAKQLRSFEVMRAKGNAERIQEISFASDDELIRNWLWVSAIAGAPVCFLILPFALSLLQPFLYPWLTLSLWIVAKTGMILVFFIFILAAYFTHKSST